MIRDLWSMPFPKAAHTRRFGRARHTCSRLAASAVAVAGPKNEYAAVSAKIDALYGQQPEPPAYYETTGMARLRREVHARMLGNGLCTRSVELDCRMESACETCAYFRTTAWNRSGDLPHG